MTEKARLQQGPQGIHGFRVRSVFVGPREKSSWV
jgi:hypothetical protein